MSGKVVKINGKKIDKQEKQLDEYHEQSFCKQTDEKILQLASLDNMITRVKNEQLSVQKIYEEEQLRLGALGIEAEKILRSTTARGIFTCASEV